MELTDKQKEQLFAQIDTVKGILPIEQLNQLLEDYSNLTIDELKPNIEKNLFSEWLDSMRNNEEKKTWESIENTMHCFENKSFEQCEELIQKIEEYKNKFNNSLYAPISKANEYLAILNEKIKKEKEKVEAARMAAAKAEAEKMESAKWEALNKESFDALYRYILENPETVHKNDVEEYMFTQMKRIFKTSQLERYLEVFPEGKHSDEVIQNQNLYLNNWTDVKQSCSIFNVKSFLDKYPNVMFITEVRSNYFGLKDKELTRMKENPSKYDVGVLMQLLEKKIFSKDELIDEGLITESSWEKLIMDKSALPVLNQQPNPKIQAPEGCTDIYFFGIPSTGKTCLLMGLAAADGNGYSLNTKVHGGGYAADLAQYVDFGVTPPATFGSYVTVIKGEISNETQKGTTVEHKINLIEMSGEEFAIRIADGKDPSFADMGTGVTNLLKNGNRKVFFIIVDPTVMIVEHNVLYEEKDNDGTVIRQEIRKKYINQKTVLARFASLFELEENQDIMQKVDAIHIITTKSDTLGMDRNGKAKDLLLSEYKNPLNKIYKYCEKSKRINVGSSFKPRLFTFSLGTFYLGGIFDFDRDDTIKLVDVIRAITIGEKNETWCDKVVDILNRGLF